MGKAKAPPFKASATPSLALLLNPLAWLLWILDFLLWFALFGWVKTLKQVMKGPYSVECGGTAVRRKTSALGGLSTSPVPASEGDVRTTGALLKHVAKKYGSYRAMGTRTFLGDYKPEGAKFPLKKFGETTWITFQELHDRSTRFGAALVDKSVGMKPLPPGCDVEKVTGPHTVLLFEDTSAEWMICALGALSQSLVVATSYATLGIDAVGEAINESHVPVVVANRKQVAKVCGLKARCPSLKTIVYTEVNVAPADQGAPPDAAKGVRALALEDALALGDSAHILEFCAELTCLTLGMNIGYADPRTLTSTGAVRERPDGTINRAPSDVHPPGAIQEFKPTFMAGVPKVWDILKKGMEDKVAEMSFLKKLVFEICFVGRAYALRQHRDSPLLKLLVFKKFSAMLGGNLKGTISGGGAIASEVQTFVRTAFSAPAVQGYALTETCCSATIQPMDDNNLDGVAGPPLTSVEIRLESCDINDRDGKPYLSTDKSHYGAPCCGRGEVQMKGPPLTAGYFKQPDKTAEVFTADGWFRSGDVGVWRPDGMLVIVDRLKNLIKLKGGEYIAIESMEKEYSTSPYVSGANGGLLCYGDSDMDRPVAFVVADEKKLQQYADEHGIAYASFEALCADEAMNAEVLRSLVAAGKAGKLGSNEILAGVLLLPGTGAKETIPPAFEDPWTPENGMLTASNKLQRKPIIKEYGAKGRMEALKAKGIK
ncbi:decanoate-CoA ligase [Aureococcus anophagefferens]|uniref:Decanoate-CoA ligase n=1 Tax=Aureococcus anophagefferens TaxID=44056 RepID=A0ABR1G9V6_AURAN